MTFDGDRRQLANDVMQWAMFLLAIAAIFLRNHSQGLEIALGLLACSVLISIVVGHRWLRFPRVVHDARIFRPDDNKEVWTEVRDSYCYFGMSGGTMQVPFRVFTNHHQFPRGATLRMLLAMPFSDAVRDSKELESGHAVSDEEIATFSLRIEEVARFYAGCITNPSIEVRFYNEYHGYWGHIVNGDEAIVGHYLNGKDGLETLVLHLKRGSHGNELFQFYKEEFDRIWRKSIPIEEYFRNKSFETQNA